MSTPSVNRNYLPGTEIEIIKDTPRGHVRHALFDFDGTISLLREGWQEIMGPVCVEMICGQAPVTPEVEQAVYDMIDETTGIQTIFQMERLVELVRSFGLVPEGQIRTPAEYKQVYNDRLMVPVRNRIARLAEGQLTLEQVTVRGVHDFLRRIHDRGVSMYVFSGTDQEDVRNEAKVVQAAAYFEEIWGALPSVEEYSKEKVIKDLIAQHSLHGPEVVAIGDGPVELRNVKEHGGIAIGVASDEARGYGWDEHKRERLIRAGADIVIPDFSEGDRLLQYLFGE
ncbi:MAG: HAD hydrolase-like protein [Candidatus Hydrogenedentes bacterium]|nr:HAD hydrolase-like protein [Candidatus Hydrogenedentota bacterium]